MGQEQSLPQETNEPDNKNNIINTTTNNTIENDNDKNVKENIDNNDASLNKSGKINKRQILEFQMLSKFLIIVPLFFILIL